MLREAPSPLVDDYAAWIDEDRAAEKRDARDTRRPRDAMHRCRDALKRLREGIDLLGRTRRPVCIPFREPGDGFQGFALSTG